MVGLVKALTDLKQQSQGMIGRGSAWDLIRYVGVGLVDDSAVVGLELVALEGVVGAVQNFAMDSA